MIVLAYAFIIAIAFAVSIMLTRWAIVLSLRHEAFELPGPRKIHLVKTPNLGWVGMLGGFFASLAVVGAVTLAWKFLWSPDNPYAAGMIRKMPLMAGVTAGGLLSIAAGWVDDAKRLNPAWKILIQIGLALFLYGLGIRITLFGSQVFHALFTVVWVLCVMNSFNLLDNADGACAGVAMIACALFLCVAAWLKQYFIAMALGAFLGALGGFLVFNFPPAKIFMGNAGSSFVGYTISALTILETFYRRGAPSYLAVMMPVLLLAVPAYDTVSVILVRLSRRLPVWKGDTNHLTHRLVRRGLSSHQMVCIIYAITLAVGAGSLFLPFVSACRAVVIVAVSICLLLGLGVWEWKTR